MGYLTLPSARTVSNGSVQVKIFQTIILMQPIARASVLNIRCMCIEHPLYETMS